MTSEGGGGRRSIRAAIAVTLAALAGIGLGARLAAGHLERRVAPLTGLNRSIYPTPDFAEPPLSRGPSGAPDLLFIVNGTWLPRQDFSVRWDGFWNVPAGPFDLYVRADDRLEILVGGNRALTQGLADGRRTVRHTLNLTAGVSPVRIDYVQRGGPARLALAWAPAGGSARPLDALFFREQPSAWTVWTFRAAGAVRTVETGGWWAFAILLIATAATTAVRYWRRDEVSGRSRFDTPVVRRALGIVTETAVALALTCVGAILRVEALVAAYGTIPLGSALESAQTRVAGLGPWLHGRGLIWRELGERSGDPVAYLNNARLMTWFYDGLAREPLFIYATKWWLWASGDADIAVSAASTMFSILCVPATYVVGRLAFGPLVGIVGASLVAIEPALIRWGVQGWRDDAFTFAFLAFAATCLWFRAQPSTSRAILLALAASAALLTRLTALSFVGPAFLLLTLEREGIVGQRLRLVAVASMLTAVLVAPYLVSSWMRHADPLIAINRNTQFYRERAGQDGSDHMRVDAYLASMAQARPVATADTFLQGVTTYPFRNKFRSLSAWGGWLPRVVAVLAVGGVLIAVWSTPGRLLLVLLLTSLVPYAFTWQIPGGAEWRFTMHVYPLFLLFAGFCAWMATRAPGRILLPSRPPTYVLAGRAAVSIALALLIAGVIFWMPYPRSREELALEGRFTIRPGFRDLVFFRNDWLRPAVQEGITVRVSRGDTARIWVPLVPGHAHEMTVQLLPAVQSGDTTDLQAYLEGRPLTGSLTREGSLVAYAFQLPDDGLAQTNGIVELRGGTSFGVRSIRMAVVGDSDSPQVSETR